MKNSLIEQIATYANQTPNKTALIVNGEEKTFLQLWNLVQNFASYLKKFIKKGDQVVGRAQTRYGYFILQFATNLLRGVFVPLEKDCAKEKLVETVQWLDDCVMVAGLEDDCVIGKHFLTYDEIERLADQTQPDKNTWEFPEAFDPCLILFTTGTTGKAKGVVIGNEYIRECVISNNRMGFCETTRLLDPAPLNHIAGIGPPFSVLYKNGTSLFVDGLSSFKDFYNALEVDKANSFVLPPAFMKMLLAMTKDYLAEYESQIRYIELGGEKVSTKMQRELIEILPNTSLNIIYASSEGGHLGVYEFSKDGVTDDIIAEPSERFEYFFVDENWKEVKATKDSPANITIRAKSLMREYYKSPEETKKAIKDGCLRTSDCGYLDEKGYLHMLGRASDVINSGGLKIIPSEVENEALAIDGVKDCVCYAKFDEILNNKAVLDVVLKKELSEQQIKDALLAKLENFKVPKQVNFVSEIKRNKNGKIDRKYYKEQR